LEEVINDFKEINENVARYGDNNNTMDIHIECNTNNYQMPERKKQDITLHIDTNHNRQLPASHNMADIPRAANNIILLIHHHGDTMATDSIRRDGKAH